MIDRLRILEQLFESTDQGIAVYDCEHMLFANKRYMELLALHDGYVLAGVRLADLRSSLADAGHPAEILAAIPIPGADPGEATRELHRADGTWLEFKSQLLDDGLYASRVSDISARKSSEAALQAQSDILNDVFDNVAQGLAAYDENANVITWNRKYQEFLILGDDDIYPGCPVWDLVMLHARRGTYGEGDLEFFESKVRARIAQLMSGEVVHFDYVNADGIQMEAVSAPRAQGGFVVTYADITERKQQELELIRTRDAAQAANLAKSSFLATMSHEIRTPMNGVIGLIEVLSETALDEDQRTLTSTIQDSAMTLLTIIDDILDFSKIEAGRMELELVPVSLRRTTELTLDTVSSVAETKGLDLTVNFASDVPDMVLGDPIRLRQILLNLLGNAVKYTETGAVTVRFELREERRDDSRALIDVSVIDTGIGISAENQAHLFQPFSQAESTTTRRYGGTGLGLSISRRLVDLMGGTIEIISAEGEGSTFRFAIPFEVVTGHDEENKNLEQVLSGTTVLLLCDRKVLVDAIEMEIVAAGGTVLCARSAGLAESLWPNGPFVLVVDDRIQDPHAQALIERMTSDRTRATQRIVLIRGQSSTSFAASLAAAFDTVVNRPVHRDRLLHSLVGDLTTLEQRTGVALSRPGERRQALGRIVVAMKGGKSRSPILLVAEDNATNRMLIERQLKFFGVRADFAQDGEAALELWRRTDYDLVLTDCHMPRMDGFDLTRAIRGAENEAVRHVPIIALTANAMVGESERCLNAGMNDYLAKPVTLVQIRNVLLRWIESGSESHQAISDPHDDCAIAGDLRNADSGARSGGAATMIEYTAVTTPTALPGSGDDYRLPRPLPGIDLEDGLDRMMGNEAFFRDMLLDYLRDFGDAIIGIEKSIDQGLQADARMQVHALRGVAASLAAVELSRSAAEVERTLANAQEVTSAQLSALRCAHEEFVSTVSSLAVEAAPNIRD